MTTKTSLDNYTIPDIEKVVEPFLDGRKVTKVDLARLTAPGENYISLVFRADFEVVDQNGKKETVNAVAKRLPVFQKENQAFEFHRKAMRNEIRWYREVVPLLKSFADEYGIDSEYFPTYLGSRLSLDPESKKADSEAVLLVKNLLPEGYANGDRLLGFDLNTAKSILKSLAAFHGTALGMKFKKPEQFEIIKNILVNSMLNGPPMNKKDGPGGPAPPAGPPEGLLLEITMEIPACQPYKSQLENLKNHLGNPMERFGGGLEPWTTVGHQDFWGNNIMVTKSREGESAAVKILDFQACQYTSYARDLAFFLLTSLKDEVMKQNFDDLLRFYYEQLTSVLEIIDVPELQLSYDDFLEEVNRVVPKYEVMHVIFFTCPIFATRTNVPDHLTGEVDVLEQMKNMVTNLSDRQKERLALVVEICVERGWM